MKIRTQDGKIINIPDGLTQDQISEVVDDYHGKNSGFLSGVRQDSYTRARNLGNILESQEPSLGKTYLALGQSAGLANDVIGRTMSAVTPDFIGEPLAKAGKYVFDTVGSLPSMGGGTIGEKIPQELDALAKKYPRASEYAKATGNIGALFAATKIGSGKPVSSAASAAAKNTVQTAKGIINVADDAAKAVAMKVDDAKGLLVPDISPQQRVVVGFAKKHKIPVEADDISNSNFYKTIISEGRTMPLSGSAKHGENVQKAINRAAAKTFGQNADHITPEVISSAYNKLGNKFQSFTKGKTFEVKESFYTKLEKLTNRASRGMYGKDGQDFLPQYLDEVKNLIDENGFVTGDRLDKVRRQFAEIARTRNDDIGRMADDIEATVVDIISSGDKKVKAQIKNTKYQYKNLKTIQRIALKDQVDGNIRPELLTNAVKVKFGEDAFAKGKAGDLGEIARVAQMVKDKIPNSGTSQRTAARALLAGNIGGAFPVFAAAGPAGLVIQAALSGGGLLANRALQSRNAGLLEKMLEKAPKK